MQQKSLNPHVQGSPLILLQKDLAHNVCLKGSCYLQGPPIFLLVMKSVVLPMP